MVDFVDNLLPASFNGVSFLVPSESVDRGKKYAIHEYANTDVRYVEELGKLPPIFTLTGIVHGSDSFNQRLQLENALERKGLKELVHPIYGAIQVKSLDFSVSSSQTEVGQFVFNMKFAQSRENITPSPSTPTNATISGQADLSRENLDNRLEALYTPPKTSETFNRVVATLQDTFDTVRDEIQKVVGLSTTGAARFSRVYRTVTNNITAIVSDAETLKNNITLFYTAALDAPVFVEQLGNAWDRLLQEPLTISSPPTTEQQSIRQQDNYAIVEHMRLTALASSYEAKVYTEYSTDVDLANARAFLNENYKNQLKRKNEEIQETGLASVADGADVRSSFADLRSLARKVFDEREKAVFRITTINPRLTSMSLAAYRYYGNHDLLAQLLTLNPDINHAQFDAEIKALTE